MKKIFALLLCIVSVVALFAGCGKEEKKQTGDGVITIGMPKSSLVTDYYNNYYTQWLQQKMQEKHPDFKLEFQFFAAGASDYQSQLSTMVLGKQKLPDILYGFGLGTDTYERYGKDKVFVDLAPYFNDKEGKAKEWWARFGNLSEESQSNIWRRMQSADGEGHIYAFPEIQESLIDIMDYQVWINQAWLDYLKLEMPTDTESFRKVLEAFKTGDPNQNGIADEYPLVGTDGQLSGQTLHWLINMFIYEDDATYWNVKDGQLYSPYTDDRYREALKFIRGLYKDGLMSPLTLTAKSSELHQMVTPADGGVQTAGVVCGHITLCFVQDDPGLLNYQPLPLWGNALFHENTNTYTTFVTSYCDDVDLAWELLMLMASEESSIIQRYGKQGTPEEGGSWTYAPEGTTSVMGTKATIRLYQDTWGTMGNDNWRNVEATILFNAEGEGNQEVDANSEGEVRLHKYDLFRRARENYLKQIEEFNPPEEEICPLLVWPQQYKDELPDAREACKSYISKARTDFITGTMDINNDADWDKYLAQLKTLGFDQWLFYSQKVYEETMAAKG